MQDIVPLKLNTRYSLGPFDLHTTEVFLRTRDRIYPSLGKTLDQASQRKIMGDVHSHGPSAP